MLYSTHIYKCTMANSAKYRGCGQVLWMLFQVMFYFAVYGQYITTGAYDGNVNTEESEVTNHEYNYTDANTTAPEKKDPKEENQFYGSPSTFPYRVCSASGVGDIFRFQTEHKCPDTNDMVHNEGILLIYKQNIVPFMFRVRKYRKVVTTSTVYNGIYSDSVTNQHTFYKSIATWETEKMDTVYQCFNSLKLNVGNNLLTYVDRDDINMTVFLQPVDGVTTDVKRYGSQPDLYLEPGWFWGSYRRRTTVNCELTDMFARSNPPFDFFVTATGDTVEMSPFWTGPDDKENKLNEKPWFLTVIDGYKVVDYENRGTLPQGKTRIFLDREDYTLSWEKHLKNVSYCPLTLWKSFHNGIQTVHSSSYHFVANDITASFTVDKEELKDFNKTYSCLKDEIQNEMQKKFEKINSTHSKVGEMQYFKTEGGLFIVWQPLIQNRLIEARSRLNNEALRRVRRQTDGTSVTTTPEATVNNGNRTGANEESSENAISAAQVQYAYDNLRMRINNILEDLSKAWCREQHRAALMWNELSKINPTSVMTMIYNKPVSAKRIGDVISVSNCIIVDQNSVSLHKSLRVPNSEERCFSRPPVTFKFTNDSTVYKGQLGVNNEILLTTTYLETCQENTEYYFQAKKEMYVYKNYEHLKTVPLASITTLDTFIALNFTLLENVDFKVIELYTRDEKRLSNVFDIETMFREYNYYTQRVSGLRKDLLDLSTNRNQFVDAFGSLMDDLGAVGQTVVNAVSGVATLFSSIVTGFINFIKNPFGGMLIILVIIGVVVALYFLTKKTRHYEQAPVKMIYPDIEKLKEREKNENLKPISQEELDRIILAMHTYQQNSLEQLKEKKAPTPGFLSKAQNMLRKRSGYTNLVNSDSVEMLNSL
ncbi:glycoprotein B [Porcine lymphotropic herpesvirus 3]|uniref:Glycoprotein B n=2 Tax=Macavirus suidgamma5 TaxID=3050359 RepID=Q772V1_9GAMA|nr:glycoprotein B [Porcine lymphotropic herpesvirus 3]AAO12300.1 glycoprotein B [Porcine lymphotropic herpesvirus 3]AAO12314.1 glycoprotein B [Porcine lymphotropic herpesvirus 3]